MEAEGLSLSRDVNLQPFQFHPALQKPFRLDDLTSRTKVPFAFHFLHDKRGRKKVLYIVMLPHLSDISKIEVQGKDQYKLKVNTKKKKKAAEERSYITMFGNPFARPSFSRSRFVCLREKKDEDRIGKLS